MGCFVRLIQLSTVGEVFLEGTCPLSRRPQTAKLPAPCSWRTEKVGEKSDSFSRAERTRPLRPCVPLAVLRFWKHSGGMFSTGYSFLGIDGYGTTCPYECMPRTPRQLDQPDRFNDSVSFRFPTYFSQFALILPCDLCISHNFKSKFCFSVCTFLQTTT